MRVACNTMKSEATTPRADTLLASRQGIGGAEMQIPHYKVNALNNPQDFILADCICLNAV